jgi:hypothetical protein
MVLPKNLRNERQAEIKLNNLKHSPGPQHKRLLKPNQNLLCQVRNKFRRKLLRQALNMEYIPEVDTKNMKWYFRVAACPSGRAV